MEFMMVCCFLLGLIVGSFLNVCVYRIPLKLSLMGRSFCPNCQTQIPFYRNVPVLAFLFQKGRSACCQKPISWRYPLVEFLTGLLSVAVYLKVYYNPMVQNQDVALEYLIWFSTFACPLLVISLIDFKWRIIPDVISLPFIIVGVLVNVYAYWPEIWAGLSFSGLGILCGGGVLWLLAEIFSRLLNKEALGGGDIKLMGLLGAFLGFKAVFFIYFVSSVLAMIYFGFLALIYRGKQNPLIPFGPFLSLAGLIFWFCGPECLALYRAFAKF